jgi:hypothetical protein
MARSTLALLALAALAGPGRAAPPPSTPVNPIGHWTQVFEGDVKTAAEVDAKVKFAKEKDTKKFDAFMKAAADATGANTLDITDGTCTFGGAGKAARAIPCHLAGKPVGKVATLQLGPDAALKAQTLTLTFSDADDFSVTDPFAGEGKAAQTLVYERK